MTPSVEAQPTHEPVDPWSPTFHHAARRSLLGGGAATAATAADRTASWYCQSVSVFFYGSRLQIRLSSLRASLFLAIAQPSHFFRQPRLGCSHEVVPSAAKPVIFYLSCLTIC